jgi:hypothetical protein
LTNIKMKPIKPPTAHVPPPHFVRWLAEEAGRAAYFSKVDPALFPSLVSKFKHGSLPITLDYAIRLERAQKASDNPLRAEDLMTFVEDRQLYRYVIGRDPAPPQIPFVRKPRRPRQKTAEAQHAAA